MNPTPQRDIAFYEVLAQVALVIARRRIAMSTIHHIQLRQWSDNLGDVSAVNRLFSTAKPLKYALQLLAAHLSTFGSVCPRPQCPEPAWSPCWNLNVRGTDTSHSACFSWLSVVKVCFTDAAMSLSTSVLTFDSCNSHAVNSGIGFLSVGYVDLYWTRQESTENS